VAAIWSVDLRQIAGSALADSAVGAGVLSALKPAFGDGRFRAFWDAIRGHSRDIARTADGACHVTSWRIESVRDRSMHDRGSSQLVM
jgi:hypothetical protein